MALYHWAGISDGQHSDGDIEANNEDDAKAKLQAQKVILTKLDLVGGTEVEYEAEIEEQGQVEEPVKKLKAKNIKNRDLMIFTKKLATMIKSGLPILKTLGMLESQTEDRNFKQVIHIIYQDVESGSSLSEAFAKHDHIFDTIYINLLRAGEMSGKLTTFLEKLVVQIEKSEKIRAKVKKALTYPTILIIVAVVVIVLMLVKVVPVFEQMFSSMGHSLPAPTQVIINMSRFLQDPSGGGVLFFTIIGLFVGIKIIIKKSYSARKKFHKLLTRIPLVGEVIQKSTLSKMAMVEGNLSAAGVSVIESLEIVEQSTKNVVYKEAIAKVREGIKEGKTLSVLYTEYPDIFPAAFCQMIEVGEETGNLDEMFETTARYYEEEFDMVVDRLTELLEPFMIVFMGLTIGFIIVAMYMPIFQIGQTMS
jgi:type IV pilus assembly protein PilC